MNSSPIDLASTGVFDIMHTTRAMRRSVWHLFVVAGTVLHFVAVLMYAG